MRVSEKARAFTLIEITVTIAVIGIVAGLSFSYIGNAIRRSKIAGERFTLVSTLNFAKQRAVAKGRDIYVVFKNLDSTKTYPDTEAPEIFVYDDVSLAARSLSFSNTYRTLIATANAGNVRDRFLATSDSGLRFRYNPSTPAPPPVSNCNTSKIPTFLDITSNRSSRQAGQCDQALCTFCQIVDSACVGIIRFDALGQARIINDTNGKGGLLKLVDPFASSSTCIAIAEPSGLINTVSD